MSDNRYIELINKEIDGLISEREKLELQIFLNTEPAAKNAYEENLKASEMLKEISDVNPTPNLKKYIFNSIDPAKYGKESQKVPKGVQLKNWFGNLSPKIAYSFAAGIILGLIIYSVFLTGLVQDHTLDNSKFYGTIGLADDVQIEKLEQVPIKIEGIDGVISFYKYESNLWLEVKISNLNQVRMTFEFDQTKIEVDNFKPLIESSVNIENISDRLTVEVFKDGHFLVKFNQISTEKKTIDFRLIREAKIVYQYKFRSGA